MTKEISKWIDICNLLELPRLYIAGGPWHCVSLLPRSNPGFKQAPGNRPALECGMRDPFLKDGWPSRAVRISATLLRLQGSLERNGTLVVDGGYLYS